MKVISREEIRVATLAGAVVLLKAGEEREVADEIGHIALQMGAEIVGMSTPTPAPAPTPEPVEETMDQDLVKALEEIIANGDPKDFKADGAPKAAPGAAPKAAPGAAPGAAPAAKPAAPKKESK